MEEKQRAGDDEAVQGSQRESMVAGALSLGGGKWASTPSTSGNVSQAIGTKRCAPASCPRLTRGPTEAQRKSDHHVATRGQGTDSNCLV
jgi:hypothetical protein